MVRRIGGTENELRIVKDVHAMYNFQNFPSSSMYADSFKKVNSTEADYRHFPEMADLPKNSSKFTVVSYEIWTFAPAHKGSKSNLFVHV